MSSPSDFVEFLESRCHFFMFMGMTHDEYWHGDVCMARYFYEAHVLREEVQAAKDDQNAWLQGLYYMRAIDVSTEMILKSFSGKKGSKKIKARYPEKPLSTKESSKKKKKKLSKDQKAALEVAQWEQLLFSQ